jgi:uncharacterized protein
MRWLMGVILLVGFAPAMWGESVDSLPAKPAGYVDDYAGVLSADTVQSLETLCGQVDREAHAQIAVVTIKTIDPDKSGATPSIEEFANALFQKWGAEEYGPRRVDAAGDESTARANRGWVRAGRNPERRQGG